MTQMIRCIDPEPLLAVGQIAAPLWFNIYEGGQGGGWFVRRDAEAVANGCDDLLYRIRIRPWIKWEGGECPVPGDTEVKVRYRNGWIDNGPYPENGLRWWHSGGSFDIIAYQIMEN